VGRLGYIDVGHRPLTWLLQNESSKTIPPFRQGGSSFILVYLHIIKLYTEGYICGSEPEKRPSGRGSTA
jgi:hypothetical protein